MDYQALLKQLTDAQLLDLAKYCFVEASDRKLENLYKEIALNQQELDLITTQAYQEEKVKQLNLLKEKAAEAARKKAREDVNGTEEKSFNNTSTNAVWCERKAIAAALQSLGINNTDWCLTVWTKNDKRIYFNDLNKFGYVTYYHTGTHKFPPGTIQFCKDFTSYLFPPETKLTNDLKDKIKKLFAVICKHWNALETRGDTIAQFDGQPNQASLNIYLQAILKP